MDRLDSFLSTNVLSFDVLTILTDHFVLFYSILGQTGILCQKEKQYSVKLHDIFFVFYVG